LYLRNIKKKTNQYINKIIKSGINFIREIKGQDGHSGESSNLGGSGRERGMGPLS
jgi:hypothetical protein